MLPSNQRVYEHLGDDVEVTLVVPRTWRDELRPAPYRARVDTTWAGHVVTVPTVGRGRPQRHVALVGMQHLLARAHADAVIIEEEPFSVAALTWAHAAHRRDLPYGVQVAENLPRRLPAPVAALCRRVLAHAAFVLARSPGALARAREWGYAGPDTVVPHSVDVAAAVTPAPGGVVGFVGRLVPSKGVDDVVAAVRAHDDLIVAVAGEGPLRTRFEPLGTRARLVGALDPAQMAEFYDAVTVLAVPSRTTPTWVEQFGRVIVEAQVRARPVVAYGSGEIPWVASLTAADVVVEGDVGALGTLLARYARDPGAADEAGLRGRDLAAAHFSHEVVGAQIAALVTDATRSRSPR